MYATITTADIAATAHDAEQRNNAWLTARRSGIGASEVLATHDAGHYQSAYELYIAKTDPTYHVAETIPMRHGHMLEPIAVDLFERETGIETMRTGTWRHNHDVIAMCSPDRLTNDGYGLEIKTTSERNAEQWDDCDSDLLIGGDIPDYPAPHHAYAQVQWCMHVTGIKKWWVAVMIYGQPLRIYQVDYDADVANYYAQQASRFWYQHVVTNLPPEPSRPRDVSSLLSRITSAADGDQIDDPRLRDLAAEHDTVTEIIREATDAKAAVSVRVKQLMGSATTGSAYGQRLWSWRTTKSGSRPLTRVRTTE